MACAWSSLLFAAAGAGRAAVPRRHACGGRTGVADGRTGAARQPKSPARSRASSHRSRASLIAASRSRCSTRRCCPVTWQNVLVTQIGVYVLLAIGLNVVVGWAGLLDLGYIAFYAIGVVHHGVPHRRRCRASRRAGCT